ncbi:ABC transporter ATP-binding protein [Actinoplanes sp. TBRC 11911]|uniref:ABC transporter ATP-binding protein n=1 Tax=Actinoplanes sp. TBRC 11911 TaxID=2729386 RepID=UPI00145F050E|nr:ABC transporter ATP-binding protein [Actinoplanes sp. TBRC 11911]NMO52120.1 ABC transporter ATP-binding protein [Actinoplanes sp. TBRC 11911]
MITLSDVAVRFGAVEALPSLSLEVDEGEFFTLLGPSGCGKTTALRAIAGFAGITSGEVRIAGRDVTRLPSGKRDVGMVFQNYALFPSMNVRENIAFGLKSRRRSKAEVDRLVDEIAEQVDLSPDQLTKSVADMSGGQQQRVAIARALVMRPKILLLDEPLSNLDAKLRQQLRVQLKDLQKQFGITTVYVTHDQEEALSMSDRVAVLNRGRLEQVGRPEEIYERAASEFVCTFVGEANKLSPRLTELIGLNPDKSAYVRFERVRLAPAQGVLIPATVTARTFHGAYSKYRLRSEDDVLQMVLSEDRLDVGQELKVVIDPADVLQYPGAAA